MANINDLASRACGLAGCCLRRVFPETCVFGSCESVLVWVLRFELFGGSAIHLFFLCSGSRVAPALCASVLFFFAECILSSAIRNCPFPALLPYLCFRCGSNS